MCRQLTNADSFSVMLYHIDDLNAARVDCQTRSNAVGRPNIRGGIKLRAEALVILLRCSVHVVLDQSSIVFQNEQAIHT